ncbi:MAG: TlpA disulfide reductase family protein [Deferrisomatales bacterium]|nr:TlpA disulfide reductase family protein [Deferrisomatales bacterium]
MSRSRWRVALAAGLAALCWGAGPVPAQGTALRLKVGDVAPDFSLEEFSTGQQRALSDYLGRKVVMLDFWATWCGICVAELPRLVEEYEALRDRGYELLAVTLSRGDRADLGRIRELQEKHGITYPLLMDTSLEVARKLYGLAGPIPIKVIIDCEGKIRATHMGDSPEAIRDVERLLDDPACRP